MEIGDFAMDDERKKSRLKEATNELAHLISSLKLHIEEYVQLAGEEIVDAKYNIFS